VHLISSNNSLRTGRLQTQQTPNK